jgi:alkanesulfonate monooxygenase SsuD/methylene tetrahydromethanopterin reductase-like flavin-dependent oxidoreductase (luciferase family)
MSPANRDKKGHRPGGTLVLKFGVFDHLDSDGTPLGEMLEKRLKLLEIMDREAFYGFHMAEHHSTPLGWVPSPSVFVSAAIQRTKRLRIGPLVYVLPMYHPLRVYEEVCMLDHMSGGRFMFGRGAALVEHQRYGIDPAHAPAMYHEAYAVIMKACEVDVLNFEGKYYGFKDYIVQNKPVQHPHPPVWYGAPNPDAVGWAAPNGVNVVSLGPAARARAITDRYRKEWAELGRNASDIPMMGITRHILVAPTDKEAKNLARPAYAVWREAIEMLWQRSGIAFPLTQIYPTSFDELEAIGHGIAGSPSTVRDYIGKLQAESGVNYVLGQMMFGTLAHEAAAQSITLFAREVIPAFTARAAA